MTMTTPSPIKIGVSSCLLGEKVRYDGGHKHDRYITDTLGRFFRFVPVCPEVGCGLPVPREAMRLERDGEGVRLVTNKTHVDHTNRMLSWCAKRVTELEREDLCGFIFKKDSPSSGLFNVKVYSTGMPAKVGRGLFARAVTEHFPLLPVEEEGRLHDMGLRENFIERVFAYRRWKDLLKGGKTVGRLVEFHTAHKLLIMAHSPAIYREMGKLVAHGKEMPRDELFHRYQELFLKALALHATVRKNTNVLQHIAGYFKKELTPEEKGELQEVIGEYHQRLVPLIVPVTLLRHYIRKYGQDYLLKQVYLSPTPQELMLRNHV
ncbi:DUF523 and DUF1722 domain-containing protein [Geobacter sp.]|uniref:YbgA family protein n=1 Tax=Geobacter sp. TaxID=46610 RepID=UPI0027BB0456|nr:DUF523 and DUF1722 domain-containing protein [Geobacter sp.]